MESEGPYTVTQDDKYIQAIKAQAYAEGRKSMEKDFKELLRLADGMRSWCNVKEKWAMIWGRQFDDWKKARGVE